MILNELFEARDPEQLAINAALAALHRRATSKGDRQSLHGYAFDIVKSFRLGMDARQLAKLYRERYSNNENISENKVNYSAPNFEYEWKEALRYPEFRKIGKDAWIELAGKGKAVTIRSAKGINNTDAADPNSFASLDKTKQARALDQLKSGTVEMPIVAVYSDGWKELVGGNTRLTAMLAQNGKATVWAFKVPDEVAELAENFADGNKNEGAEITMWTNPAYQGADVDDEYYNKQPAKLIDVNKLTPFEPADKMNDEISDANMGKLVTAIQAGEKINPIVVVPHKGKLLIVDGHHRYFAHLKAGADKIRAVIADPKDLTWRDDVPESIQRSLE